MARYARFVLILAAGLVLAGLTRTRAQQPQSVPGTAKNEDAPAVLFEHPPLKTEAGFTATLVVPPGTLQDPLSVVARPDGGVWVNDDGGVAGQRGGFIWGVNTKGKVTKVVDESRGMPMIGFDVAPQGFGPWGGELLWVATPTVMRSAVQQPHIIQHVKPNSRDLAQTICTLPNHGTVNGGVPGAGTDAQFGPAKSPFADRFFVITIINNSMYQMNAKGECTPFATFDGGPQGLAFAAGGRKMFVTVRRGTQGTRGNATARGAIMSVNPDGTIDPTPVFERPEPMIKRIAVAPKHFGAYAGEIFFTDWGLSFTEGPDKAVKWDGTLWRVSRDGQAHLVASGFSNPAGIAFSGRSIYVADVNRDGPFLNGKWVAEGFLVRLDLAGR